MQKALFVASVFDHLKNFHVPFMRLLQNRGVSIHAAANSKGIPQTKLASLGIKCIEIPFARSPFHLSNLMAGKRLRQLLCSNHYDLIHVHTPMAAFMTRWLAKLTSQGAVVYTAHGFHFYRGAPLKNWALYYSAERIAANWTDGLIVMNSEDYVTAQRLGFVPNRNLFLTHGVGVDLTQYSGSDYKNVRQKLGISTNDIVFICIGELNRNKNQSFILRAWQAFATSIRSAHLLVVGEGPLERHLKYYAERMGIPRVQFLGYRQDVPALLSASDVLVHASQREGLPRCIMEAMSAGKPVIATNIRGNRDLVDHQVTGLLVELDDLASLTTAFTTIACDPTLRLVMGKAASSKVRLFSLERVLEEVNSVYDLYLKLTN